MGTKDNPGKFDCYTKALPDEPMFVLLARDRLAPLLVDAWALVMDAVKVTPTDAAKVAEARACADAMRVWRSVDAEIDRQAGYVVALTASRVALAMVTTAELRAELARRLSGPDREDMNIPLGGGGTEDTHVGRYRGVFSTESAEPPRALFLYERDAQMYTARASDPNNEDEFVGADLGITRVDAVLSVLNTSSADPYAPLDNNQPPFTIRVR